MPEIHNPDHLSRNSGGNAEARSFLVFLALIFLLFLGYQTIRKHSPSAAIQAPQVQLQTTKAQTAIPPITGGQTAASSSHFGWLTFIAEPLYLALCFVHDHGIGNWGWAIIVLTALFNLLLVGPRIMAMKTSLKMMRIQPKVDALRKRHAHLKINDPGRDEMNAEMIALYRDEGASLFGGCLPMLLQMPLLFAYISVLRNATELQHAHWLWLTDLSLPDPLHILPLLIIASMALVQWITPAPSMNPSQRWMLALLMPVVMGFSLWHYASGLSLYWLTGNIISLLVQLVINQSRLGKEMIALAAERAKIRPKIGE